MNSRPVTIPAGKRKVKTAGLRVFAAPLSLSTAFLSCPVGLAALGLWTHAVPAPGLLLPPHPHSNYKMQTPPDHGAECRADEVRKLSLLQKFHLRQQKRLTLKGKPPAVAAAAS